MTLIQMLSAILIMFSLLGICFLVVNEKTISKKTKIRTMIVVSLICMVGTAFVEYHNAPSEYTDMLDISNPLNN